MRASKTNAALNMAIALADRPILAGVMRRQPLPPDILTLIKVASGCRETWRVAANVSKRNPKFLRTAAILYLQTVMFAPEADAYRVLGVPSDASQEQLREHLRWLMKWLHPDRTKSDWESAFVRRVLEAWQEVKSADRRARYDRKVGREGHSSLGEVRIRKAPRHGSRARPSIPWIATSSEASATPAPKWGAQVLRGAVILGAVALVLALVTISPQYWSTTASEQSGASSPMTPAVVLRETKQED